jgi:hypothetical protein
MRAPKDGLTKIRLSQIVGRADGHRRIMMSSENLTAEEYSDAPIYLSKPELECQADTVAIYTRLPASRGLADGDLLDWVQGDGERIRRAALGGRYYRVPGGASILQASPELVKGRRQDAVSYAGPYDLFVQAATLTRSTGVIERAEPEEAGCLLVTAMPLGVFCEVSLKPGSYFVTARAPSDLVPRTRGAPNPSIPLLGPFKNQLAAILKLDAARESYVNKVRSRAAFDSIFEVIDLPNFRGVPLLDGEGFVEDPTDSASLPRPAF